MDNKQITQTLKKTIQLMELHEENIFKIKSYQTAVNSLEREGMELDGLDRKSLLDIAGIGKGIAEVILEILTTGTHSYLEELLQKTPYGILEILKIKGLGPRKIKYLWKNLNITSVHELMEACQSGEVAKLKGFGEKTQLSIMQSLDFITSNKGKWLYADIEMEAEKLLEALKENFGQNQVAIVGDYARNLEIIDKLYILIATEEPKKTIQQINAINSIQQKVQLSSPYRWGGTFRSLDLEISIFLVRKEDFVRQKLIKTGSRAHLLSVVGENNTLSSLFLSRNFQNEEEAYQAAGMVFIPPELREGQFEIELAKEGKLPVLLEMKDLKGPLHNHSTYSDGKHSLKDMALHCQSLGYEYLGIADHSQSAFYANGLDSGRVAKQHAEIDQLNKELAPFRIFKGIESDILIDGSLDYPENILSGFDYIVASIHTSLGMDMKKATARLLKAVSNPYTTILGHPTGRLLLRREGYPLDHKTIIEACAKHNVVIEINANPWRLDLDWRWVHFALEKGVKLSINPDAHEKEAFEDMKFGVLVGRKGGLCKNMTLNALSLEELDSYFEKKKKHLQ